MFYLCAHGQFDSHVQKLQNQIFNENCTYVYISALLNQKDRRKMWLLHGFQFARKKLAESSYQVRVLWQQTNAALTVATSNEK